MSLVIDPVNNAGLSSVTLVSPKVVDWEANGNERVLNFKGQFFSETPANAHALRDELFEIVNDVQRVNVSYSGESGVDGSYFIERSSVDTVKIGPGLYKYRLVCLYVGASQ